jgi:hypothetical protein
LSFSTRSEHQPDTDPATSEEGPAQVPAADTTAGDEKPADTSDTADTAATAAADTDPDTHTDTAAASTDTEPPVAAATATETATEPTADTGTATDDKAAAEESVAAGKPDAEEATPDTGDSDGGDGDGPAHEPPTADVPRPGRRGWRTRYPLAARIVAWTTTALAAAFVLAGLLVPNSLDLLTPDAFVHIPLEAVLGAAVLLVLPRWPRLVAAALGGLTIGALAILNLLDMGFKQYLGRGFNLVLDWPLFADAESFLQDSIGRTGAIVTAIATVVAVVLVLALMTLAVIRLSNLMARNTAVATRTTLVLGTAWITCTALGLQVAGEPVASKSTVSEAKDRVERVDRTLKDEAVFAKETKKDNFAALPGDQLLTGLRGKDMMFTFIESYGRSAIEDPIMAPGVDATLTSATAKLKKAGWGSESGWLTSATYGAGSWLGHSTFMSGLWISNQQRYRTVMASDHMPLTEAFRRTGAWETVGVMPGVQKGWPEGKYYGLDRIYDSHKLGYKGPKFSWSTMPDQYTLKAFERLEHSKKHAKPLMSFLILTSSHNPWAPIPKTIPDSQVGDGSVYDGIEKAAKRPTDVWKQTDQVRAEYGKSIQYSVTSLIDYVIKYGNKNTVLVFLGDHQPIAKVSGNHASRDVPVAIVAHDPKVLDKIADWHWTDGLQPAHDAPVWKMSSFRDRFLTAYGKEPTAP